MDDVAFLKIFDDIDSDSNERISKREFLKYVDKQKKIHGIEDVIEENGKKSKK